MESKSEDGLPDKISDQINKNKDLPIADHDIQSLLEGMIKGIFNIENGLYSQASFEFNRLSALRNTINTIEKDLLTDSFLKELPPKSRLGLYYSLQNSMYRSMDFLQKLHVSVASGIDSVGNLTKTFSELSKIKTDSKNKQNRLESGDSSMKELKEQLLGEIRKRTLSELPSKQEDDNLFSSEEMEESQER